MRLSLFQEQHARVPQVKNKAGGEERSAGLRLPVQLEDRRGPGRAGRRAPAALGVRETLSAAAAGWERAEHRRAAGSIPGGQVQEAADRFLSH